MNRGEIRNAVREYLNEPQPAYWSNASLDNWINIAVPIVHNKIKAVSRYHFTTRATFPTVVGTEYYSLPADCKDVKLITRLDSNGREIPLSMAQWPDPTVWTPEAMLDPTAGSGDDGPSIYWLVGPSIRLLPRPSDVVTLKLYYEARGVNLTQDSDVPTFDADYHDLAAKWAAIEAGVKDGRSMSEVKDLWKTRLDDLFADVLHRVPAPAQVVEGYMQA